MPELPEVDVVAQGLNQTVKHLTIKKVQVFWPNMINTDQTINNWTDTLVGETIEAVRRRGKYILFELTHWILISHLRMEGKYLYFTQKEVDSGLATKAKHTHVIFHFIDDSQLHYHDVRKFGHFECIEKKAEKHFFAEKQIGPEPLSETFTLENFSDALKKSKQKIKPYLLSQKPVAGLGNIYVDESLFQAKIHPGRLAYCLTKIETAHLYEAIRDVLSRAVLAGGSTIRTYKNTLGETGTFQTQLQVYGRQGEPCPRCHTPIKKIQLGQRGTHFCPQCQKE